MEITDFLKDVNHWGVLAVCVYGITVFMSNLFKDSVNEKIRIVMTVIAVAFLVGIIIWVLFFSNDNKEITASNSEVQDNEQLAAMKRRLDTALKRLDIQAEKITDLRDKNSALERQVISASENRDNLARQLDDEKTGRTDAENRLAAQIRIHSDDIKRLSNAEVEAKTEQGKISLALKNVQSNFDAYRESADRIIAELQIQLNNEKLSKSRIEQELRIQININSDDIKQINSAKAEYDRALRTLFFGNNEKKTAYYTNALKLFREKANESTEARFLVGYILDPTHKNIELNDGEKQNAELAIREYEIAAQEGHEYVQFYLDILRQQGAK